MWGLQDVHLCSNTETNRCAAAAVLTTRPDGSGLDETPRPTSATEKSFFLFNGVRRHRGEKKLETEEKIKTKKRWGLGRQEE